VPLQPEKSKESNRLIKFMIKIPFWII
jgi:hypothetical protein